MPKALVLLWLGMAGTLAVAACGPAEPAAEPASAPSAEMAPVAAPGAPLPTADLEGARRLAPAGADVQAVSFERTGSTTVTGSVKGDVAPVYAVPLAAGQTLTATFKGSNANLYFNAFDASDASGTALHRGELNGDTVTFKTTAPMTVVLTPFQPRAMARRNEGGDFTLTVTRD